MFEAEEYDAHKDYDLKLQKIKKIKDNSFCGGILCGVICVIGIEVIVWIGTCLIMMDIKVMY